MNFASGPSKQASQEELFVESPVITCKPRGLHILNMGFFRFCPCPVSEADTDVGTTLSSSENESEASCKYFTMGMSLYMTPNTRTPTVLVALPRKRSDENSDVG